MGELFVISDEFEKQLHPEARKVFHNWNADVQRQVQLAELNNDDLKYLSDDDRIKLKRIVEIPSCLNKCVDIKDGDKLYDVYFGDIFLSKGVISQLRKDLLSIEFDIVPPLKKIYEGRVAKAKEEERKRVEEEKRKAAKVGEEQRRREEAAEVERRKKKAEERWGVAYKELNIPANDASKYLKPEEHEEFADSILGAVDAYLDKKESYILDSRADAYLLWINEIYRRKEEERQQIADNLAARGFNNSLSKHIAGLKSKLNNRPRDLQNYFTAKIQDKRYTGHNFDYVLDDEQERGFDATLVRVANDKLKQIIPRDLLEFIEIPSTYYRLYFPLPSISYSFEGIPCLVFSFENFATAYAEVLLKPKVKKFGICSFNLPAEREGNVLVPLEEPKLLGYFYILLTPEDLGGYTFWRVIPLVLLSWLLEGGTKPPGITISEASDDSITYKVQKFKEEVDIPDKFADYLKNIGSFDGMLNMGIVNEKVTSVAKNELSELKVEHEASPLKDRVERKDTKKAKAFRLFDGGKAPSDREIKALKIKPKTSYNYYQEWKKITRLLI